VSLAIDLMHLVVIAAGIGIGALAMVTLRKGLPHGRFLLFGASSAGARFGCAALAGEVGILPPTAWFAIVMAALLGIATIAIRAIHPKTRAA
jgi:hypothetical protein